MAAVLAVGAAALAPSAADAATQGMRTARFAMTVSGTQTTDWRLSRTDYDGCVDTDVHTTGSGTERIAFRSERPAHVDLIAIDGELAVGAGPGLLPVTGAVEQEGVVHVDQFEDKPSFCGGTENPQAPPARDCGTRSWSGTLSPGVLNPGDEAPITLEDGLELGPPLKAPVLELAGPDLEDGGALQGLFANCPGAGGTLATTRNAVLPSRKLFSKARRVVIRGSFDGTVQEHGFTRAIALEWRAVLVRRRAGA